MNVKSRSRERAAEETKVVAMRKGELEKADGKEGTGTARQGEGKYGSRNRPGDGEMQRVISDTTGRHLGSSDLDCMSRAPVSEWPKTTTQKDWSRNLESSISIAGMSSSTGSKTAGDATQDVHPSHSEPHNPSDVSTSQVSSGGTMKRRSLPRGQHYKSVFPRQGAAVDSKHERVDSNQGTYDPEAQGGRNQVQAFPGIDLEGDVDPGEGGGNMVKSNRIENLLDKVPQSMWQPNMVVRRDRRKANMYWVLLLIGYVIYVVLVISNSYSRRQSPPVQIRLMDEPFQLPDIGFCFEGNTYGSRFGCYDGEADGKDCAESYTADVFVYGYNITGYTTPDGYPESDEFIVLLPDALSDTCRRFRLSTLTAITDAPMWNFHMLMFWNSSYNATANPGAFESIKMYLYEGGMDEEAVNQTPITLYAPISFDAQVVPFVRGFLSYEQQVNLNGDIDHKYTVMDTTSSPWHNAEDAVNLAADYGTDALASIQLDVRTLSYYRFSEVDPVDIVGALGEISGFWLVVPLMFALLFYRNRPPDEEHELRSFENVRCGRRRTSADAKHDFN